MAQLYPIGLDSAKECVDYKYKYIRLKIQIQIQTQIQNKYVYKYKYKWKYKEQSLLEIRGTDQMHTKDRAGKFLQRSRPNKFQGT